MAQNRTSNWNEYLIRSSSSQLLGRGFAVPSTARWKKLCFAGKSVAIFLDTQMWLQTRAVRVPFMPGGCLYAGLASARSWSWLLAGYFFFSLHLGGLFNLALFESTSEGSAPTLTCVNWWCTMQCKQWFVLRSWFTFLNRAMHMGSVAIVGKFYHRKLMPVEYSITDKQRKFLKKIYDRFLAKLHKKCHFFQFPMWFFMWKISLLLWFNSCNVL